jgi:predicted ATP-grasp superfamily ATP-dependent carboligase
MLAVGNSSADAPLGRVLVLDGWERMALAVCRAIGRLGYSVGMAGTDPRRDIASRSRYVRRYDVLPDPWGPAAPYEMALHELIEREGYVAVVSVHDSTLARLASIDLPVPTLSHLDHAWAMLQDKVRLGEVCERAGLAYPQTEPVQSPGDVGEAVDRLGLPLFIKSSVSAKAYPDRVAFARGAVLARTPEDAATAATDLWGELPVIAQRRIDRGTKLNAVVLRRDGRSELRYAHRVLRENPREGGTGISLQSIDPETGEGAEAVTLLERLCEEVGYRGIVQAEMYRSASDGDLVVVDVNPRLWGSTWFAERQGLRVVERSLRAALDLPPLPPPVPRPGMRFHVTSAELHWLWREPSRYAGLRDLVRTTRPRDVFEWIDPTDPMPTLRWFTDGIGRAARRRRLAARRPT